MRCKTPRFPTSRGSEGEAETVKARARPLNRRARAPQGCPELQQDRSASAPALPSFVHTLGVLPARRERMPWSETRRIRLNDISRRAGHDISRPAGAAAVRGSHAAHRAAMSRSAPLRARRLPALGPLRTQSGGAAQQGPTAPAIRARASAGAQQLAACAHATSWRLAVGWSLRMRAAASSTGIGLPK